MRQRGKIWSWAGHRWQYDKCFACCMTNVADKIVICNIYLRHPVERFVMPYSCSSCSMCLVHSDILWNFRIDMKGILHRHSRTSGEHSCLFRSVELCSNNGRLPYVEQWCTPDEKQLEVEMSCVLLMGVSHSCCNLSTHALPLVGPKLTWLMCSDCIYVNINLCISDYLSMIYFLKYINVIVEA
jgi:hypothetical protein